MIEIEAKKDGNGNIIISENCFEVILDCLDNQKFMKDMKNTQNTIDYYNRECRKILHQKYIFQTTSDGYLLSKRYEYQNEDTEWNCDDTELVRELYKDTQIIFKEPKDLLPLDGDEEIADGTRPIGKTKDGWICVESDKMPWLIERPLRYDYQYLTISEDGENNRPWKQDEIEKNFKII